MASPRRPSTPSHAAPPAYPSPSQLASFGTSPGTLPSASPRRADGVAPLGVPLDTRMPLLGQPSPPQRLPSPWRLPGGGGGGGGGADSTPLSPDAGGALRGEGRALVEWALATARHASPYIGVPQSPLHHACASAVSAAAAGHPSSVGGLLHEGAAGPDGAAFGAAFAESVRRSPRLPHGGLGGGLSSGLADPRMSPQWRGGAALGPGGLGAAGPMAAAAAAGPLERPSTDPRGDGPGVGLLGGGQASHERPSTDPHYSLLRRSPRLHPPNASPLLGPRGASTMPPPPPRRPADGDHAAEAKRRKIDPNAPLSDGDIEAFLEPDMHTLDQQYGSMTD